MLLGHLSDHLGANIKQLASVTLPYMDVDTQMLLTRNPFFWSHF